MVCEKYGEVVHYSAALSRATKPAAAAAAGAPPLSSSEHCIAVHVRRGDACINPDRRCHDYDEYEAGAGRIQRAYGLHRLYVLSDADDVPLARWGRRFTVEHQTAMNRSRYSQKPRACERRGADGSCDFGVQPSTFPEVAPW